MCRRQVDSLDQAATATRSEFRANQIVNMNIITRVVQILFANSIALAAIATAAGREAALTLMPPSEPVMAGRTARVDIVALNPGAHATSFDVETELTGALDVGATTWPLTLRSSEPASIAVPPGGFTVRHFTFQV